MNSERAQFWLLRCSNGHAFLIFIFTSITWGLLSFCLQAVLPSLSLMKLWTGAVRHSIQCIKCFLFTLTTWTNRWLQKWDYDSTGGDLYMERTMIKKCRGNAYLGSFCKSKLAATCVSGAVGGLLDPFHELDVFPPLKISTIRLLMSAPRDVSLAGFSTPKGKEDRLALSIKKSFNTAIINWFQDSLHIIIMKSDKSYLWLSLPKIEKAAFKAVVFSVSNFPYAMATWHPQYI